MYLWEADGWTRMGRRLENADLSSARVTISEAVRMRTVHMRFACEPGCASEEDFTHANPDVLRMRKNDDRM